MKKDSYIEYMELNQSLNNFYYALISIEDDTIKLERKTKYEVINILCKAIRDIELKIELLKYKQGASRFKISNYCTSDDIKSDRLLELLDSDFSDNIDFFIWNACDTSLRQEFKKGA